MKSNNNPSVHLNVLSAGVDSSSVLSYYTPRDPQHPTLQQQPPEDRPHVARAVVEIVSMTPSQQLKHTNIVTPFSRYSHLRRKSRCLFYPQHEDLYGKHSPWRPINLVRNHLSFYPSIALDGQRCAASLVVTMC